MTKENKRLANILRKYMTETKVIFTSLEGVEREEGEGKHFFKEKVAS